MSMSLFSARTAVAGVLGAGALSGAMLFGALPMANAASTTGMAATAAPGAIHAAPVVFGGHHHRHGGLHAFNVIG
jgi:hypothetical protein